MSAKWRALQHRHRFTYTAVVFPPYYIEALNLLPSHVSSLNFFIELKELISLNSIHAQVNHVKKVTSNFGELLSNGEDGVVSMAVRFYLEILFLENSLPLHRNLVSVLAKRHKFQSVISGFLQSMCDEYGVVGGKGKRFSVSRAVLSLLSSPKLGFLVEPIEECAISVALDIIFGLNAALSETNGGSRPSPVVMEQIQEALSCLYYLLQRFPSKFGVMDVFQSDLITENSNIFEMVVRTILSILKSSAFSRDCLIAAGVSFCAALQVCLSPQELPFFIVKSLFYHTTHGSIISCESEFRDVSFKLQYKGDVYSEIMGFSLWSRIYLLRGILTAVPRVVLNTHFNLEGDGSNDFNVHGFTSNPEWTILFDGILPELCNYCENPIDSHFNFHVLTVMQICLQQIKTSILDKVVNLSGNYDPLPEEMGSRISRIIWNNLEDPLNQTVKQVHLLFDLFLDIQSSLLSGKGTEKFKSILWKSASDLLRLGAQCKGRYVPLGSLTKRLGAKTILDMSPKLLFQTIQAYIDDDVCCAATSFLKCFIECLRDECWSSDGVEKGYVTYRGHCLPPILYGLVSGVSKLRSNLNTYALPVVLELDVDSIFPMLAFISVRQSGYETELIYPELSGVSMNLTIEQQVAALVSLLKVSRLLALIEGDIDWYHDSLLLQDQCGLTTEHMDPFAVVCIKGIKLKVLAEWLVLALTHVDETLRVDAAESLFLNPKTSSLPSPLELSLMKEAVPLNMRCCSTAFQMKWTSLFRKFFFRVRTALERVYRQGCWQPLTRCDRCEVGLKGPKETVVDRAKDLFKFIKWLSCFLFFSCYPSAPYERKIMAMELILIMINVWSIVPPLEETCSSNSVAKCLYPYNKGLVLPDSTLLLVGSIIDSWDRLRESSFRILLHFPTPLPGISSQDMVKEVVMWAKKLVCSPRVRESDAGALTLRLIFRKYVLELGWMVRASVNVVCFQSHSELINGDSEICKSKFPIMEYILSLMDWLHVLVKEGEKDLSEACSNSFVHGALLTLRYTFEELDWNSDVVLSSTSDMRHALEKLLELVMRITSLALWVVSADAWYLPVDMDDMVEDDSLLLDVSIDMDVPESSSELQAKDLKPAEDRRPSEQVVMVGCWLAMKEVSLLLGTIIRKIPLPGCSASPASKPGKPFCEAAEIPPVEEPDVMLDLKQLENIGNHFLEVLLKMKHNGAIDKTRAGFTALCNRLLCSNDPRLCKMTEYWMELLMERTVAKGQTVDDLLRRSAGIPAAFIAFFLSEPEGAPKKLLPQALRWLIDVANKSLMNRTETNHQHGVTWANLSTKLNQESVSSVPTEMGMNKSSSKIRDEGVIPTVHAFNVLRAAFNDTNLATDTSGFAAEALIVSIRSFSSPYWEVRNSACLAYTALVRRMIGFLNVQKRESIRRALTGLEFFHRYPTLHPFLFDELETATKFLGDGSSGHLESNIAKVVHPSLCPMLILLSRLKPSPISGVTEDALDPFLFMPFIRRCSTQNNLRVRVLASRALIGLVANEKLQTVLLNIASGLPYVKNIMIIDSMSSLLNKSNGTHVASYNSIHGMLLQLSSLLDTNCRNLVDFSKINLILGDLVEVLIKRSWIGKHRLCPCPILNGAYLQVLDCMFNIMRGCGMSKNAGSLRSLLLDLSSECLDLQVSRGHSFYDPTIADLRGQAAISYFNCVSHFQASIKADESFQILHGAPPPASDVSKLPEMRTHIPGAQERLILCIFDASYEVRLATLKWLYQSLTSNISSREACAKSGSDMDIIYTWMRTDLQPTLIKLLTLEENHRCKYYILRILFSWNLLQFQKLEDQQCEGTVFVGGMDFDSILQFWDKLILLNKVATHTKTRETLICCMGICVKRFAGLFTSSVLSGTVRKDVDSGEVDQLERSGLIYECIYFFISLIKQQSEPSEPVNMRRAAAESMVASGLLEQAAYYSSFVSNTQIPCKGFSSGFEPSEAAHLYACRILDLWFTCIKILEDEDVGLRQRLAMDVQKCFTLKGSERNQQNGAIPTQVEKVIESSFEFLSSIFGHWLEYFDQLSQWVLGTGSHVIARGDLVRRVFDKEIDNHHEEKLLICQICCFHLEKIPILKLQVADSSKKQGIRSFLQKWRMTFYHQLISFANDHLGMAVGVDWIGGLGNHKDAFLSVYSNLLGLYALSQCLFNGGTESGMPQLSDLVKLEETIKPYLRNPLISNLYFLIIQVHEQTLAVSINSSGPKFRGSLAIWEGFDPYFLLNRNNI